jgi:hypothetical protein
VWDLTYRRERERAEKERARIRIKWEKCDRKIGKMDMNRYEDG